MTREDEEISAAFRETVFNDDLISWRYWVEQMPTLSAGEAARLMCGLDPDKFQNLDERPSPKNDPEKQCVKARQIERMASREGKQSDTASNWLAWAKAKGYTVHIGFQIAVRDKQELEEVRPQLEALPRAEAALWTEAFIVEDGLRLIRFWFAGSESQQNMTFDQFRAAVSERLLRWQKGEYELTEAAQVLADANTHVDAASLCAQMEQAIHDGRLKFRKNGVPLGVEQIPRGRLWHRSVRLDDLNEWLEQEKAPYRLVYPYEALDAGSTSAADSARASWWSQDYDPIAMAEALEADQKDKGWGVNQRGKRAGKVPIIGLSKAVAQRISAAEAEGKGRTIGYKSIENYLKAHGWT